MRSKKYHNFPAFDAARDRLHNEGWAVESPADLDRENGYDAMDMPEDTDWDQIPEGFDFDACVDRDINAIKSCDAIYMLVGWQASKGARAEKALAEWLGKQVMYESVVDRDEAELAGLTKHHIGVDPAAEGEKQMGMNPDPTMLGRMELVFSRRDAGPPVVQVLPEDAAERKTYPIYSGLMAYFPDALALVAHHSWVGNEQHHPGDPLWWDKSKSADELDAHGRHVLEARWVDVAWRALANLQRKVDAGWRPTYETKETS
jgi:hypothetical protein